MAGQSAHGMQYITSDFSTSGMDVKLFASRSGMFFFPDWCNKLLADLSPPPSHTELFIYDVMNQMFSLCAIQVP